MQLCVGLRWGKQVNKLDLKVLGSTTCFIISCSVDLGDETKDVSNCRMDVELSASSLRFVARVYMLNSQYVRVNVYVRVFVSVHRQGQGPAGR